jgi:nucleoside-diphosphate kinase
MTVRRRFAVVEQTLAIIKPDAVGRGQEGEIVRRLEEQGFRVICSRRERLSPGEAKAFYSVHEGKPFFESLVEFMSGGEIVALLLEREGAIGRLREVIGATDPAEAAPGTIRADFAESKERNAIHASDSPESAGVEIPFFFSRLEAIRAG